MKILTYKLSTLILFVTLFSISVWGQDAYYCNIGIEYQISYSNNWGANKPIILTVLPNSSASNAGIKVGDIVEKINDINTQNITEDKFVDLLKKLGKELPSLSLEVSNFNYKNKKITLYPFCKSRSILNEEDLAKAFSQYSLEDECERILFYPFTTKTEAKFSFDKIKYFAFSQQNSPSNEIDKALTTSISDALKRKGLQYNPNQANIIIDTYYTLLKNPYYDKKEETDKHKHSDIRYNPETKTIETLPLLPIGANKKVAKYILSMGIRFFEAQKESDPIWTCEAVEYLTEDFSLEKYATITTPIMLMQFPFIRYKKNLRLRFASHRHNYLGISLSIDDLGVIASVQKQSPAFLSGLKKGDRIIAINEKPMYSKIELSKSYQHFIHKTILKRDDLTRFTSKDGLKNCRYWKKNKYKSISKTINKNKFKTIFSYLFAFRPYIARKNNSPEISIDIIDNNGITRRHNILPIIVDKSYITLE